MTLQIRKTAVLGAGVIHLANANVPVVLFDLTAKEGDPSSVAKKAERAHRGHNRARAAAFRRSLGARARESTQTQ
jgi:hypothetical protein